MVEQEEQVRLTSVSTAGGLQPSGGLAGGGERRKGSGPDGLTETSQSPGLALCPFTFSPQLLPRLAPTAEASVARGMAFGHRCIPFHIIQYTAFQTNANS